MTRVLADAGYDCGLVGKLHLSAAKEYEQRPEDGYRVFEWSHHPTPDLARGHAYETWLRLDKGVDPQALYRSVSSFCGPGVPAALSQTTWCAEMAMRFNADRRNGLLTSEYRDSGHGHLYGSMVFDGRWKSVVYHGHPIGEIFDKDRDSGEFENFWDDTTLRAERLKAHLDALAGTACSGPPRTLDH